MGERGRIGRTFRARVKFRVRVRSKLRVWERNTLLIMSGSRTPLRCTSEKAFSNIFIHHIQVIWCWNKLLPDGQYPVRASMTPSMLPATLYKLHGAAVGIITTISSLTSAVARKPGQTFAAPRPKLLHCTICRQRKGRSEFGYGQKFCF